ncbi:MAG TPA: hypothetical protein VK741_12625 [Acetobacteraceae bacterium]|jgi:hypothetical protein|nr:hypothetical protein [Acetobacteraceae bacterium]
MPSRLIEARRGQTAQSGADPFGSRRCQQLAAIIAPLLPDWSVERHCDEFGKPAVVIMSDDDDANRPTLVVHADGAVFHLDELRQDTFRNLTEHATWTELLRAVRNRLMWEIPVSPTLH